jgi:hypothetical protein
LTEGLRVGESNAPGRRHEASQPLSYNRLAGGRRRGSTGEAESSGDGPEGKEGVEIDDAAFIEETADADVAEIIGGDLEPAEET